MKQQFSVGDKAVYPVHGVAEVVALEQRDIGGNQTPVYILKIMDTGLKIMVPTTNAGSVGLRDLITSKQVKEVYAILKSRDIPRDTQTWNGRYREYMEKIKTGSVFEIAEVLRDRERPERHADEQRPVGQQHLRRAAAPFLLMHQIKVPEDPVYRKRQSQPEQICAELGLRLGAHRIERVPEQRGGRDDGDHLVEQIRTVLFENRPVPRRAVGQ